LLVVDVEGADEVELDDTEELDFEVVEGPVVVVTMEV
jgi:hypothetical protein